MAGDDTEELREYRAQLAEVVEALRHDPTNAELQATRDTLAEIIALSETLSSDDQPAPEHAQKEQEDKENKDKEEEEEDGTPAAKRVRAGAECEARHPCGTWYHGVVKVVLDDGTLIVDFGGLEPPVQLQPDCVRAVGATGTPAPRLGTDTGASGSHSSSNKNDKNSGNGSGAASEHVPTEVPQHLRIKATDSAEVRERKKKRIHAIKSKMRFARKDEEGAAKRAQWLSFAQKSGVARHQSIFSTSAGTASSRMTPVAGTREAFSRAAMPPPPSSSSQ